MTKKLILTEIADYCGVSPATVSRALSGNGYVSEEKRRKIQGFVNDRGSAGERVLQRGRRGREIIIVTRDDHLSNSNACAGLKQFLDRLHQDGFLASVFFGNRAEALKSCLKRRPEAVLAFGINDRVMPHIAKLVARGITCIGTGEAFEVACPVVSHDHADAVRAAVRRLQSRGAKRIAYLAGMGEREHFHSPDEIAVCRHREIVEAIAGELPGFDVAADVVSDNFGSFAQAEKMLKKGEHGGWIIYDCEQVNAFARLCASLRLPIPPLAALLSPGDGMVLPVTELIYRQPPLDEAILQLLNSDNPEDFRPRRILLPYHYVE